MGGFISLGFGLDIDLDLDCKMERAFRRDFGSVVLLDTFSVQLLYYELIYDDSFHKVQTFKEFVIHLQHIIVYIPASTFPPSHIYIRLCSPTYIQHLSTLINPLPRSLNPHPTPTLPLLQPPLHKHPHIPILHQPRCLPQTLRTLHRRFKLKPNLAFSIPA